MSVCLFACMCVCLISEMLKYSVLVDGLSSVHGVFVQLIRMFTSDSAFALCLSAVLYLIGISTSAHLCVCVCCF